MAKPKITPASKDTAVMKPKRFSSTLDAKDKVHVYLAHLYTTLVFCFAESPETCESGRRFFTHCHPTSGIDHVSPKSSQHYPHCPPRSEAELRVAEGSHPASDRQISFLGSVPLRGRVFLRGATLYSVIAHVQSVMPTEINGC